MLTTEAKEANGFALERYWFWMPADTQDFLGSIRSQKWLQWKILEKGDMTLQKKHDIEMQKSRPRHPESQGNIYIWLQLLLVYK